jgi:protein-disulfide isomerase|nr:thioredoxin domain-containing protein [Neorhizobium tomejilense]
MKALSRALVIASMLIPSVAAAQQASLSDADRRLIVREVIEHFRKNPGELIGAVAADKPAEQSKSDFTGAAMDPVHGPEDAPYSILVFSDYGCGPCNDAEKMLDGLLKERKDIKLVHRDYPVSGEDSVAASLDVIAAFNATPPQDWLKLRAGLMEKGVAPEYRIQALRAAGIEQNGDVSASVKLTLLKNRELARRAGVNTLPAIIVMKGDGVVPLSGGVTKEGVLKALELLSAD